MVSGPGYPFYWKAVFKLEFGHSLEGAGGIRSSLQGRSSDPTLHLQESEALTSHKPVCQ